MEPHQDRVVAEKTELDVKLSKLETFIKEAPVFKTLPQPERGRLIRQFAVMSEYSKILGERIAHF